MTHYIVSVDIPLLTNMTRSTNKSQFSGLWYGWTCAPALMLVLMVDWTLPGIAGAWPMGGRLSIIPGGPWEGPPCIPTK